MQHRHPIAQHQGLPLVVRHQQYGRSDLVVQATEFRPHLHSPRGVKLRQGFGRLIRTQRDRGMVVILDPRVLTKPYGRVFLNSLPDCEVMRERC